MNTEKQEGKAKIDMQQELEKQLHEQYAINNNEGVRSFIAFLAAIIALFGAFGYVFVNTNYHMVAKCKLCTCQGYAFDAYVGVALVVVVMLAYLAEISLSLGFGQRNNQIIIQRIREKYYDKDGYREIFKNAYSARDKSVCNFIPGIYNIFYWMFMVAQLIIFIATMYQCHQVGLDNILGCILLFIQLVLMFICLYRRFCHYYCKYQQIQ